MMTSPGNSYRNEKRDKHLANFGKRRLTTLILWAGLPGIIKVENDFVPDFDFILIPLSSSWILLEISS